MADGRVRECADSSSGTGGGGENGLIYGQLLIFDPAFTKTKGPGFTRGPWRTFVVVC